jgi:hypothetical protein
MGWIVYVASLLGILVLHLMGLDVVFIFDRITFWPTAKGDVNYFGLHFFVIMSPHPPIWAWFEKCLKVSELIGSVYQAGGVVHCNWKSPYVSFGNVWSGCLSASKHPSTEEKANYSEKKTTNDGSVTPFAHTYLHEWLNVFIRMSSNVIYMFIHVYEIIILKWASCFTGELNSTTDWIMS